MVDEIQKLEIKNKEEGEKEGLYPVLQAEIEIYKRSKTGKRSFIRNHMKSIFLFAFDVTPNIRNKADWLIQLKKLYEDDAEKNIEQSLENAMVAGTSESQSTSPSTETETTSHNENTSWLYHRCTDAIK